MIVLALGIIIGLLINPIKQKVDKVDWKILNPLSRKEMDEVSFIEPLKDDE